MKTKQLASYNEFEKELTKSLIDDGTEGSLPRLDLMKNYFRKFILSIKNTRPAFPKTYKNKLTQLLKKQVFSFLNGDDERRMYVGSYHNNPYYIAPIDCKGELYFTLVDGSFEVISKPLAVSEPNKVIDYFVKNYPNADFAEAYQYKLLYEMRKKEEQLNEKSKNEFRRSLASATNFQKNKKKWLKIIKPLIFPTVDIPLINKETNKKIYVKAQYYGGLAYTKLLKEYVIIHGSGVLVMDGIRSQNDIKVITVRVTKLMNWNRPLSAIQKDFTSSFSETLLRLKLNPYL